MEQRVKINAFFQYECSVELHALIIIILIVVPFRYLYIASKAHMSVHLSLMFPSLLYSYLLVLSEKDLYYDKFRRLDLNMHLHPKWLTGIYFPVVCIEQVLKMDMHVLRRSLVQVMLLSTIVILLHTLLLAGTIKMVLFSDWPFAVCVVFGLMTTWTEVHRSVMILSNVEKAKHLVTVMQGVCLLGLAFGLILMEMTNAFQLTTDDMWRSPAVVLVWTFLVNVVVGLLVGLVGQVGVLIMHNDRLSLIASTFVTCYGSYYVAACFCKTGVLATVLSCIIVAPLQKRLSNEMSSALLNFWEVTSCMMKNISFIMIMGVAFARTYEFIEFENDIPYPQIGMLYFIAMMCKLIAYMIMSPFLSRTGYGMNFKGMVFTCWSPAPSTIMIIVAIILYHHVQLSSSRIVICCTVAYIISSSIVNSSMVLLMAKYLGFADMSEMRRSNIKKCTKYVIEKRNAIIASLKMNRFLSDANWPLVNEITTLRHPLKKNKQLDIADDLDDELFLGMRPSFCPSCNLLVPIEPNSKEAAELTRDGRLRILKSERVSYIRQFEKGLLSQEGIRSLLQAVEIAVDSPELTIKLDDYYRVLRKKSRYDKLKKVLQGLQRRSTTERLVPKKRFNRICYKIANNAMLLLALLTTILLHVGFLISTLYFSDVWLKTLGNKSFGRYLYLYMFLHIIYWINIVVRILGMSYKSLCRHGLKFYFKKCENVFEFLVCLSSTVLYWETVLATGILKHEITTRWWTVTSLYTCSVAAMLLIIVRVIEEGAQQLILYCDRQNDIRIAYSYEIGHALVNSFEEVEEMLPQMVSNAKIRNLLYQQLENDRLAVTRELGLLHKYSPSIGVTTKTRQAIKATLNHINQTIFELKSSGFLDLAEYMLVRDSLEERYRAFRRLKDIHISTPRALFKEVQWLGNNEEMASFLYDKLDTKVWDSGDVICDDGHVLEGLIVLVTGLLRLTYTPNQAFLDDRAQTGALPVFDYIVSFNFKSEVKDYIFTGNSIGENCALTHRPYNCRIVAEVPSQGFILNNRSLKRAMAIDNDPINGLECRMWKYISFNLAMSLMMETTHYQKSTQDNVRLLLETSFVPNLVSYKILIVTEQICDIVLIEGEVLDAVSMEHYIAPKYIPRNVQKIATPNSQLGRGIFYKSPAVTTKLLIVPVRNVSEYEVMEYVESISELVPDPSSETLLDIRRARMRLHKFHFRPSSQLRQKRFTWSSATFEEVPINSTMSRLGSQAGSLIVSSDSASLEGGPSTEGIARLRMSQGSDAARAPRKSSMRDNADDDGTDAIESARRQLKRDSSGGYGVMASGPESTSKFTLPSGRKRTVIDYERVKQERMSLSIREDSVTFKKND